MQRQQRIQLDDFVERQIERSEIREDGNLRNVRQVPVAEVCVVQKACISNATRKSQVADVGKGQRHGT